MDKDRKSQKDKLKVSFDHFLMSIRESLTDLTTLEVNSILAHDISADHPSDDEEFLHQTCINLADWFKTEKNKMDSSVQKPLEDKSLRQMSELCDKGKLNEDDKAIIKDLLDDVTICLKHKNDRINDAQRHKCAGYRRHLRYLKKYLELHNSSNWNWPERMLEGREHQQLRKLWEVVDTAFIYAQTVVGLDGDVISRLNQQLFDNTQKIAKDNAEKLMHFHSRNVEAGANYRNSLMDTFVRIIGAVFGRV